MIKNLTISDQVSKSDLGDKEGDKEKRQKIYILKSYAKDKSYICVYI